MARSALLDAVATLFFAVRLAVHTPPNSQLVLHGGLSRRKSFHDPGKLHEYLRWQAGLRSLIPTPDIILVPWKQPAIMPDDEGTFVSKQMAHEAVEDTRIETESSQEQHITITKLEDKLGYVEEALVCSQQEIASLRDKLAKAESSIRKYERRRSRMCSAIAKSAARIKETYGVEPNVNIPCLSNNNRGENNNGSGFVDTSPVSVASPRISHHDKENVGRYRSEKRMNMDTNSEVEKLRAENSHLRKQLQESTEEASRIRSIQLQATPVRTRTLASLCDSSPLSSPEDLGIGCTAPYSTRDAVPEKKDAQMMGVLARKEAAYARNRCEAMASELEELRSYKRYVREWVVSFIETTRSEKNALYGQLAAAQLTASELRQVSKAQQEEVQAEIYARLEAEGQLNALRNHHNILAQQLAARNAQLEAAHAEMVSARNAYEAATQDENDNNSEETERERQELQASLANMANLANHTQTRLAVVEKQLAAEKLRHKNTVARVQSYHNDRNQNRDPCHSSSPSSSSSKQQRGLRSFLSPSKKKRQPLGETQLPQVPHFQDLS